MSDIAISIENVSKRYLVGHRAHERERYTALRDVIAREARSFGRKALDAFRGRQIIQGDTVEEFWVLKHVSFEVSRGEVIGIIGNNGAGKSTLLKILSRITEPTEGRVGLRGRVASLLEVGTGFHPELTGRENVFLNGAILGMTRREIRNKFDEIVAFAGVEKFLDTPVKHFSSGMYVRLAFAVAAHLEPEILVIDEVLAVGDAEFQAKCLGKMQDAANSEGRAVLFVSHNMAAVRALCKRAVVLKEGCCVFDGPVAEAIGYYSSLWQEQSGVAWARQHARKGSPIYFTRAEVTIGGQQPNLKLLCTTNLECTECCEKSSIVVDISDSSLTTIMQAEPSTRPFIDGAPGSYTTRIEIDLPPLIPGLYAADFWVGPHNSRTYDWVRRVATFEVTESPTPGRCYPHTVDHGSIVPISRCADIEFVPRPQVHE